MSMLLPKDRVRESRDRRRLPGLKRLEVFVPKTRSTSLRLMSPNCAMDLARRLAVRLTSGEQGV